MKTKRKVCSGINEQTRNVHFFKKILLKLSSLHKLPNQVEIIYLDGKIIVYYISQN